MVCDEVMEILIVTQLKMLLNQQEKGRKSLHNPGLGLFDSSTLTIRAQNQGR